MKVVESLKTRGSIIHFEGFLNDFFCMIFIRTQFLFSFLSCITEICFYIFWPTDAAQFKYLDIRGSKTTSRWVTPLTRVQIGPKSQKQTNKQTNKKTQSHRMTETN